MPDINLELLNSQILGLENEITRSLKTRLNRDISQETLSSRTAWREIHNISFLELKTILENRFRGAIITEPSTSSHFPDLKMEYQGRIIAFDIKTSSTKSPAYDIARLDSIFGERIDVFGEEYDIVIRYNSSEILNVYFCLMRNTVGVNSRGGTRFREYDGKLRPKSWRDFEAGTKPWESKENFESALKTTIVIRYKTLLEKLNKILTPEEKKEFKKLFD